MSDGPHRSLPMRTGWRRVARRGDKTSFAIDEIGAALGPALKQDCREELPREFLRALMNICRDQEGSLFKETLEPRLEALRTCAGPGIGRVVLEDAVRLAAEGKYGPDIAVTATENALIDRATRGARQVEEHYFRESTTPRAHRVRERIEQAIGNSKPDIRALARNLLGINDGSELRRPLRQMGLDDGVRL